MDDIEYIDSLRGEMFGRVARESVDRRQCALLSRIIREWNNPSTSMINESDGTEWIEGDETPSPYEVVEAYNSCGNPELIELDMDEGLITVAFGEYTIDVRFEYNVIEYNVVANTYDTPGYIDFESDLKYMGSTVNLDMTDEVIPDDEVLSKLGEMVLDQFHGVIDDEYIDTHSERDCYDNGYDPDDYD